MYWMLTLLIAVLGGLCGFFAVALNNQLFFRTRAELEIALRALRGMKWGSFAQHVVALLEKRGLTVDEKHERQPGEGGVDLLMRRGSARYLVQCKHSGSYQVSLESINEIVRLIQMREAAGAFLVNAGISNPSLHQLAAEKNIEILESTELWHLLEPLLPFDLVEEIHQDSAKQMRAKLRSATLVAVGGAILSLIVAFVVLRPDQAPPTAASTSLAGSATPVKPAPAKKPAIAPVAGNSANTSAAPSKEAVAATSTSPVSNDKAAPSNSPPAMPDPSLTPDQIEVRRSLVEETVRQFSGVRDAAWNSRSTMVLTLDRLPTPEGDPGSEPAEASDRASKDAMFLNERVEAVCAEITRFEEMRFTRLQVQFADPRDDADARVRWRQCD